MSNDNELVPISHLETMLAQSTRIDELVDFRHKVNAVQIYARNIKASKEVTIEYSAERIKAEHKLGQVLRTMSEAGELGNNGYSGVNQHGEYEILAVSCRTTPPELATLDSMGISRDQSSDWQSISRIPKDVLDQELFNCIQYLKEPTTKYFAKLGKRYKPRVKNINNDDIVDVELDIEVIHGDMLNVLPELDMKFGLVIADPPYNVTNWEWDVIGSDDDFVGLTGRWLDAISNTLDKEYNLFWFCSPQYMCAIELELSKRFPIQSRIIWHRRNMSMGSDSKYKFIDTWEMIFHCGNKPMNWDENWDDSRFDVQTFAVPQTNFTDRKLHPTQKPIGLIERLVKYGSYSTDIVLDPFAGSGTTGIACLNNDRNCVLIELNEGYIEVINERLQQ